MNKQTTGSHCLVCIRYLTFPWDESSALILFISSKWVGIPPYRYGLSSRQSEDAGSLSLVPMQSMSDLKGATASQTGSTSRCNLSTASSQIFTHSFSYAGMKAKARKKHNKKCCVFLGSQVIVLGYTNNLEGESLQIVWVKKKMQMITEGFTPNDQGPHKNFGFSEVSTLAPPPQHLSSPGVERNRFLLQHAGHSSAFIPITTAASSRLNHSRRACSRPQDKVMNKTNPCSQRAFTP